MSDFVKGTPYRNKSSNNVVSIVSVSATTVTYTVKGMSAPQRLAVSVFNNLFEKV
jgi:hypothetical protein